MGPIVNKFIQRDIKKLRTQIGEESILKYDRQLFQDQIQAIVNVYTDKKPYINREQQYLGHTNWYLETIEKSAQAKYEQLLKEKLRNKTDSSTEPLSEEDLKNIERAIKKENVGKFEDVSVGSDEEVLRLDSDKEDEEVKEDRDKKEHPKLEDIIDQQKQKEEVAKNIGLAYGEIKTIPPAQIKDPVMSKWLYVQNTQHASKAILSEQSLRQFDAQPYEVQTLQIRELLKISRPSQSIIDIIKQLQMRIKLENVKPQPIGRKSPKKVAQPPQKQE